MVETRGVKNPKITQKHINRIIEFRQVIHANGFGKQQDELSEALRVVIRSTSNSIISV